MQHDHQHYIRRCIEVAEAAVAHGNRPFGAVLVDSRGRVVLEAENTVATDSDCTGHAETNLVRTASQRFDHDHLSGCSVYTSTEPCPMCAGAIYWSGVHRVVYGCSAETLFELLRERGERPPLRLSCREVLASGGRTIEVIGPLLEEEARRVHERFRGRPRT